MRGFSWKRAIGISSFKAKVARATGIPTTRAGRARKWGFWPILTRMTAPEKAARDETDAGGGCSGCLVLLLLMGGCGYALSYLPSTKPREREITVPTPEGKLLVPAPASHESERPPVDLPIDPDPPELLPVTAAPHREPDAPAKTEPPKTRDYKQDKPEAYGQSQINLAKQYLKLKQTAKAREILSQLIEDVPGTEAALTAKQELDRLPH